MFLTQLSRVKILTDFRAIEKLGIVFKCCCFNIVDSTGTPKTNYICVIFIKWWVVAMFERRTFLARIEARIAWHGFIPRYC